MDKPTLTLLAPAGTAECGELVGSLQTLAQCARNNKINTQKTSKYSLFLNLTLIFEVKYFFFFRLP